MKLSPPAAARRSPSAAPPLPPPTLSPPSPLYHWRPVAWVARLLARPPQKIRAWCTDGTFAVAAIPVYCDASGYWWIAWPEEGSFDIPIDDHVGEVLTLVANGAARRTAKRSGYSSLRAESRRKKLTRLIA